MAELCLKRSCWARGGEEMWRKRHEIFFNDGRFLKQEGPFHGAEPWFCLPFMLNPPQTPANMDRRGFLEARGAGCCCCDIAMPRYRDIAIF